MISHEFETCLGFRVVDSIVRSQMVAWLVSTLEAELTFLGDKTDAKLLHGLGAVYYHLESFQQSLEVYERCLALKTQVQTQAQQQLQGPSKVDGAPGEPIAPWMQPAT